ncbi:MAG: cadmium-translocating P-type ATPase [Erysipelotrichaceae bacterium]|nr:cadmium-translocating P-type ATPase [Erysipelotrichaceae bacterium]
MKKVEVKIINVDCANCAAKIEEKIKHLSGIEDVHYQFMTEKLSFTCHESIKEKLLEEIEEIVHMIEPDASVEKQKKHHHHEEHCNCGHEHHHHHEEQCKCGHEHHHEEHCNCGHEHHHDENVDKPVENLNQKYQFVLEGLDCANCAAKVERYLNQQKELSDVQIHFMSLTLKLNSTLPSSELKSYIQNKINEVEDGVTVKESKVKNTEKNLDTRDEALIRILVSAVLLGLGLMLHENAVLSILLYASCYLCVGSEILLRAIRNILKGQIFDENFLMAVATIGAVIVSEYAEACAVMLFYQIGEYFQNKAVKKSRRSISDLMDIRSEEAHVEKCGKVYTVEPEDVEEGDILVVRAGEKIPLDGIILEGKTSLDTRALTGESKTQNVEEMDEVLSGSINLEGLIKVQVTKPYHDSTVARILDLVENAGSRKAPAEAFITKFARAYTPFVCLLALLIAVIPPLMIADAQWMDYLYRACTFLVISCPCALVVSVPLSYFAGIGGLSSQGILVKGSSYLDALCQVDTYVFDKTGTLTKGSFELTEIISEYPEHCLSLAAAAEKNSNHPIAQSIVRAIDVQLKEASEVHEITGRGVECIIEGKKVLAGNGRLMEMHQIELPVLQKTGTMIHVAEEGKYLGTLLIQDTIRHEAKKLIAELRALEKKTVMLTGDQKDVAQKIADELKINQVHAQLLPQDKVKLVEDLMEKGSKVAFTGDGINDAPVLAISSVGFAMGVIGSDAAIEAADIVIMNDHPESVLTALKTSLKTRRIVMENIYGALFVKFVILLLGAMGKTGMWAAVFADVGVAVLAILNAIRAMKKS